MAEHEHGTMETDYHQKTFYRFVNVFKWAVILILAFLVFLAVVNG